jgi:hypothetical protein
MRQMRKRTCQISCFWGVVPDSRKGPIVVPCGWIVCIFWRGNDVFENLGIGLEDCLRGGGTLREENECK